MQDASEPCAPRMAPVWETRSVILAHRGELERGCVAFVKFTRETGHSGMRSEGAAITSATMVQTQRTVDTAQRMVSQGHFGLGSREKVDR